MDKLLTAFCLLLLFLAPILLTIDLQKEALPEKVQKEPCTIFITVEGVDKPLPLDEYVLGVVAGEMPMNFHDEALKAQSIAARTYALRLTNQGQKPIAATVSAQVFLTKEERKKRWGKEFKQNEKRLSRLVADTKDEMIVYNGEMITAMFFSTSNGKTETAENYSGNPIPYLTSVESPGEDQVSSKYEQVRELSLKEWNEKLNVQWTDDHFKQLQLIRNQTDRVQKVVSKDFEMNGRTFRERFDLPSTDFNIAYDMTNQIVHLSTIGYGHGVGMSQYGAEVFAQKGWNAHQIIQHYYRGVEIKKFENDESECLKTP